MHGAKRNAYRILGGEPEGNRLLGRRRLRWKDNIQMDLGYRMRVDWIHLAHGELLSIG
jgi:hypothetical protein